MMVDNYTVNDFSFSRFDFIVRTDRQTDSQRQMNAILNANTIGVSR